MSLRLVVRRSTRRLVKRRHRVTVQFRQVDLMHVVHNSEYFHWFELGRYQLMEEVVPLEMAIEQGYLLPVVVNHCEYLSPARIHDRLVVTTSHRICDKWEGKFLFNHTISNEKTKVEHCRGYSEVTLVDKHTMRVLKKVPDNIWVRYQGLV